MTLPMTDNPTFDLLLRVSQLEAEVKAGIAERDKLRTRLADAEAQCRHEHGVVLAVRTELYMARIEIAELQRTKATT